MVCTGDLKEAFTGVDVALLVGSFPRQAGMERNDLLAKNAAIFKEQGRALDQYASKNVKVLIDPPRCRLSSATHAGAALTLA